MLVRRIFGTCRPQFKLRAPAQSPAISRHYSRSPHDEAEGLIYPDSPSKNHWDLPSFLSYADRAGLDRASTVYKGTLFEYTVGASLARYGFYLRRVGGASDAGIDLLGTWTLPRPRSAPRATLRVLVQCKFEKKKPGPRHIRELEGSFAGAPAGWAGDGVVGFMVSRMEATKGMREALGRSSRPMGYLACGEGGEVRQMLWNGRAEEEGLGGLGVVVRRFEDGRAGELVLTMNGAPVPLIEG
ncbi:Uncharacterized protein ESCO_003187 [Escovopsis weberi]|uniref:Required for respiratory growth protein 7, mitochondrial n=1 Tax=Escovopsis weberi TaxID=150374 RepID=A0A0M9VT74_ESCWE|nr:Uncharacterized protein ESCO_003187 [Escovopsis weberi]